MPGYLFPFIAIKSPVMKKKLNIAIKLIVALALLSLGYGCQKNLNDGPGGPKPGDGLEFAPKELKNFVQLNLVGNNENDNPQYVDPNLVNAWGISFSPTYQSWVSSQGRGICNIYTIDGATTGSSINILKEGNPGAGGPTGQVCNFTSDFKLSDGNPAQFIFATADGIIAGWNSGSSAVIKIDNTAAASYLGIAMASVGSDFFLYAANFAQNRIDVYDKNWNEVNRPFVDANLPPGYSPFNIQIFSDGKLYVMYAKKNANGEKEIGPGNGIINVFSPDGTLLKRFASKGKLNAPWGITKAPAGFWGEWSQLASIILVANNGDGHINAFDENGNFLGPLSTKGKPIEVDGLWGITFPPLSSYNHYYLYFAAGPNNGTDGLVGYIKTLYLN
jgi:uncharacterized protein (TIGR03118 family)